MSIRSGWWGRTLAGAVVAFVVGSTVASAVSGPGPGDARSKEQARNVILLVGDGMGDSEITIARNYDRGAAGHLVMDGLPYTGEYTTYAVQPGTSNVPDYVTDSAASGTAWATGHKTYNNAVSVDPVTKQPLTTILEMAQTAGYRTGNVTTAELTDATPAVQASHVSLRGCQGPQNMATCPGEEKPNGLGSVAEQFIDHRVDVLMGGGRARFEQLTYTGDSVIDQALDAGYAYVTDRAGMNSAGTTKPLLGLFAPGNMELESTGPLAAPYPGPAAARCTTNPAYPPTQPHLSEMTSKAISILDKQTKSSKKGFFLQVEGGSIDKQDHASNPCGQIGETIEFDRAIAVALAYAGTHPKTLVVVTADHGHTSQIIEPQTDADHSPGAIATLITADNQPMVIGYATNLPGRSQSHTGTEVRIAAAGPNADKVLGITDQTDLFHTMARALGLE